MRLHRTALAATMLAVSAYGAAAQDLRIAVSSEATSMDPHFHNLGTNTQIRFNIFESLIMQDALQGLQPALATEWEALDDTTWRYRLREGVKFHDGSEFTARDVIYSVCRIPTIENSPSSFTIYTQSITDMRAEDDHTLIIETDGPNPLLPTESYTWAILSADASGAEEEVVFSRDGCEGMGELPASNDFNSPELSVGTGPYKLQEFTRGERLVLTRNDGYWGEAPDWERIIIRPITSAGPRVAALLAGDVDVIESPPIQDLPRLESEGFKVVDSLSNRVIYLHLYQQDENAPGLTGTDGENPLLDPQVREAISLAINREAIVERIMSGYAEPAGELLPPPMFGTSGRAVDSYDPDRARELLAEAGYPDGFGIVLGTPNDRYINDEQVAQAVAQMLTRVGIQTQVDASTASQFFSRRNNLEFPIYLAGWGAATGEMSSPLISLVATYDPDEGLGVTNAGRYSNPEMDEVLREAMRTVDDERRSELLQEAGTLVLDDHGIIPLHYERSVWAMTPEVDYEPRVDQFTLAYRVTRVAEAD